jgi:aminoglycoside phosphotransferase (APT) family kinase protein
MVKEARLLTVAGAAGVPVPRIVATGDTSSALGSPFVVTERLEGETIPRRLLRDERYAAALAGLAAECGTVLARLHAAPPADVAGLDDSDQLTQYRQVYDGIAQPSAAFELAFRWLERRRPARRRTAIVHGDFRHGNLLVDASGLRAVLDWELAHLGDPVEDLGWLCVKSWRFGSPLPVGGFGTYDDLIASYERAGGDPVDRDCLRWWEVLGNLKWGIMCMLQARSHLSGRVRSVELAAIGRRVPEVEWDLLALLEGDHA